MDTIDFYRAAKLLIDRYGEDMAKMRLWKRRR